jgi:hypothetical protein
VRRLHVSGYTVAALTADAITGGYASDNGTGLIFEGTDLVVDCVTEVDGARTWQMTRRDDGTVDEIPLPTRLLSS